MHFFTGQPVEETNMQKFMVAYVRCMNVTTLTFGEENVVGVIVMSRVLFCVIPFVAKTTTTTTPLSFAEFLSLDKPHP